MDSDTDTSPEGHQKNGNISQKPSTTAISTIVLNSKPIQLVVAILQVSPKTRIYSKIPAQTLLRFEWNERYDFYDIKHNPIINPHSILVCLLPKSKQ